MGRPSLNRQRSRLNVTQEAPPIWMVVPTYESRARPTMSQCESPTSHTQYRSRYLVIIQGRRERCKSPLYSVRVWLKHLPVVQIKLTSTERKQEDTAQCRIAAVSARRSQNLRAREHGCDGQTSYPGSKSEKKMTEKNCRFRFTLCPFSCNDSTTGLAHFRAELYFQGHFRIRRSTTIVSKAEAASKGSKSWTSDAGLYDTRYELRSIPFYTRNQYTALRHSSVLSLKINLINLW